MDPTVISTPEGNATADCSAFLIDRPLEARSALFDGDRLLLVGQTWLGDGYATAMYAIDTTLLFASSFE